MTTTQNLAWAHAGCAIGENHTIPAVGFRYTVWVKSRTVGDGYDTAHRATRVGQDTANANWGHLVTVFRNGTLVATYCMEPNGVLDNGETADFRDTLDWEDREAFAV